MRRLNVLNLTFEHKNRLIGRSGERGVAHHPGFIWHFGGKDDARVAQPFYSLGHIRGKIGEGRAVLTKLSGFVKAKHNFIVAKNAPRIGFAAGVAGYKTELLPKSGRFAKIAL